MNAESKAVAPPSLVRKFATKYSIDPAVLMNTLKQTCFRQKDGEVSNEQMVALLVVADQYNLNPFTREIFAFPDKNNGIVPVVSVDGWVRIINEHPDYNGYEVVLPDQPLPAVEGERPQAWAWVTIKLHRKNVEFTPPLTEYLDECYKPPVKRTGANGPYEIRGPWQTHPKRFLRHKALIQAGRMVFGFSGIYDEDEAQRIAEAAAVVSVVPAGQKATEVAKENLRRSLEQTQGETLQQAVNNAQQKLDPDGAIELELADQKSRSAQQQPKTVPPAFRFDTPMATVYLRKQGTLADLKTAYREICDDFDFSGRELPLDVEAWYRDLKEGLEQKGTT